MTIGSILLGVALLIVIALVVAHPLLARRRQQQAVVSERQALEAQKALLLEQIRMLDFDYETGKIPDDEHRRLRAQLFVETTQILRRLDALQPGAVLPSNGTADRVEPDIEAAIARLRRVPAMVEGHDGESIRLAGSQKHHGNGTPTSSVLGTDSGRKANQFCTQCGESRDANDKFCAYCGHRFS